MLKNYNKYRILRIFLNSPTESFRLRELSKLSKISPLSVMNYLNGFESEGLIKKYRKRGVPYYQALRDDENFILYKKISIIYELHETGLIKELWNKTAPDAIILYGSYAKGEAIENSDIDLFIIGKEKKVNLEKFEKLLGKKMHIIFEKDFNNVSSELKNNLINGIILKGYLKVF